MLPSGWAIFLAELTPTAWLCAMVTLFILTICYYVVLRLSTTESISMSFGDCVVFVYGSLTGQGSYKEPTSISGRVVFITTFLFTILLVIHYTSWLYSMLAVTKPDIPFKNLEELMKDRSYTIGLVRGHSIEAELKVKAMFKNTKYTVKFI